LEILKIHVIKYTIRNKKIRTAAFCFIFALILYFPSLKLNWSLVDAGVHIHNSADSFSKFKTDGIFACIADIISISDNYCGPTLRIMIALQRIVLGNAAWAWHFVMILLFAAVLWAIWELTLLAGGGTLSCLIALLSFSLFGPQHVFPDFNTHYANFARFLTSDSYQIPLSLWSAFFLIRGIQGESALSKKTAAVFVLLFIFCCLTKGTAIHIILSYIAWCGVIIVLSPPKSLIKRKAMIFSGLALLSSLPGIFFFRVWESRPVVGYENVKIAKTLPAIWKNMLKYCNFCSDSLSFLWYIAITIIIVSLIIYFIRQLKKREEICIKNSTQILLLFLFISGFILQSMWPLILPRYMLTFSPYLCILFGLAAGTLISSWIKKNHKNPNLKIYFIHFIIGGILFAVIFFPYYHPFRPSKYRQIWVILSGGVFLISGIWGLILLLNEKLNGVKKHIAFFPVWFLSGTLLIQGIVLLINTNDSAKNYYAYEKIYSSILDEAKKLEEFLPENEKGTIYTNLKGEQLWSSNFLLHDTNIAPNVNIRPLPKKGMPDLGLNDKIFIIHDFNTYGIKRVPQFSDGANIVPFIKYDKTNGALWMGNGDIVKFPVMFSSSHVITHIGVNTDPYSWSTSLDLHVTVSCEKDPNEEKEIACFEGINMSRGRMGPKVLKLKKPYILPKGKSSIKIYFDSAPESELRFSRPTLEYSRAAIIKASLSSDHSRVQPQIFLWGHPGKNTLTLLKRKETETYSFLMASPSHLIRLYIKGHIGKTGWFVESFRRIRYDYATELYGP
jgi:hypothetical protein